MQAFLSVQEDVLQVVGVQLVPSAHCDGLSEAHLLTGLEGFEVAPLLKTALIVNV